MEEDLISNLPDSILVSIIIRIPTKEAVQTSILSKRWRYLYKLVSTVYLSCHDLAKNVTKEQYLDIDLDPFPLHDSKLILNRLHSFLQLHDSSHPFHSFRFHCCLSKKDEHAFEKCIYSLGKLRTEILFLSLCCKSRRSDVSFSCHFFAHMPSLKYLKLMLCSLQPNQILSNNSNNNYSLKTLVLSQVKLIPGSLNCVLSNCLCLHSLGIDRCEFPNYNKKLCLRGDRLKSLLIYDASDGVEQIELHACNLTSFEFSNPYMVSFVFDYVPQLQNVYFYIFKENVLSYVCGGLGKDLHHMKSLIFTVGDEFFTIIPPAMNIFNAFHNLEKLDLNLCCTRRINLLITLTPLLHSWPLLQEFHLATLEPAGYNGPPQVDERVVERHPGLKKVYISGFGGTQNEIDFASYVMKSAVMLQKLYISVHASLYLGNGLWSNRERPALKRKTCRYLRNLLRRRAASKTADVLIQLSTARERSNILISHEDDDN